jgi:hypothetical protein
MGYLDHSTNNIILDAVLTDYGRQKLASANSAFNVTSYSLADDEVDYGLVKRYGRTVGKEKIEKNTPIFEALTNPEIALKYRLIGRENSGAISSVYLPQLKLSTGTSIDFTDNSAKRFSVDLLWKGQASSSSIPVEFIQKSYEIKISSRFFNITGASNGSIDSPSTAVNRVNAGDPNRMAVYTLSGTGTSTSIELTVVPLNIDATTLSIYGKLQGTKRKITSYVKITGLTHGCSVDIPITYTA